MKRKWYNCEQYSCGYSNIFVGCLIDRRLDTHGKFIKPFLRPGLKILDCGCGPGSMTIDFAACVKPGEVIGIDIADSQLKIARKTARALGIENVKFQQANTFCLPFENEKFDIVFSQTLLMHLQQPLEALKEQKRVLKKNGILAARDPFLANLPYYPINKHIEEALALHFLPITKQGGDINLGIKLGALFLHAGLKDVKHQLFCENQNNDLEKIINYLISEITESDYNKKMLKQGKITLLQLETYKNALLELYKQPGVYIGEIWGEVTGYK